MLNFNNFCITNNNLFVVIAFHYSVQSCSGLVWLCSACLFLSVFESYSLLPPSLSLDYFTPTHTILLPLHFHGYFFPLSIDYFFLSLFLPSSSAKLTLFLLFLFPTLHSGCWCASCLSVLAVHLLCTWPLLCSSLFPLLLMIIRLLMGSPPIRAWVFPLPILLNLSPVSTPGHLLPTLVLGLLGRWVSKHEGALVLNCSISSKYPLEILTIWNNWHHSPGHKLAIKV